MKRVNEKGWVDYCIDLQKKYPVFNEEYEKRREAGRVGVISATGKGNIPVLFATGKNLPEAWENSLIALWVKGGFVRTQYDQRDEKGEYISPPSKDCSMVMVVEEPLSEPRIHRDFPGGLNDLEEYRQEVVDGIKDHWVRDPSNPKDKRWEYTYHGRATGYEVPGLEKTINQFEEMVLNLAKSPITRRAQIVSWKPWEDNNISDPACFQSLWGRILREHPEAGFKFYSDEFTGKPKLNLNMRFRSRDAYEAALMNDWAFIEWANVMVGRISESREEEVRLARFKDDSDSYHVYGSVFEEFLGRFSKALTQRHFLPEGDYDSNARTWNSTTPFVQEIFAEARNEIPLKIKQQDANYSSGKDLTKASSKLFKK